MFRLSRSKRLVSAVAWLSASLLLALPTVGCKDLPSEAAADGGRDVPGDAGADRSEGGIIRDGNSPGDVPVPPVDGGLGDTDMPPTDGSPADGAEGAPPDGPVPTPISTVGSWDDATWDESTWAE